MLVRFVIVCYKLLTLVTPVPVKSDATVCDLVAKGQEWPVYVPDPYDCTTFYKCEPVSVQ